MDEWAVMILAAAALVMALALLSAPVIWVLAKAVTALTVVSGQRLRAEGRDRRDSNDLVNQLLEMCFGDPRQVVNIHAQERIAKSQMDMSVEKQAVGRKTVAQPPPVDDEGMVTEDPELASRN
jgi:hypothetical protein